MTRINTNISSLTAQNTLAQSNSQLQVTLTRLSTGLQINSGADNPSGLIAATSLGNDIKNTQQAISNSQVANQMISTADSALSQVSTLLTNIQGLITQAANTATMSSSEIAANQLQIDSSLSAINRISQTTSFQGQNLLDGSLDFQVQQGTGYSAVKGLEVDQANLGTAASMPVNIKVTSLATQAKLSATANDGVAADVAASRAITFAGGSTLTVTAPSTGTSSNGIAIVFKTNPNQAAGTASASYNSANTTLTVTVNNAGTTTANTIAAAINADTKFTAVAGGTTPATAGFTAGTDAVTTFNNVAYTATNGGSLTINSLRPGTNAATSLNIATSAQVTTSSPTVSMDGSGNVTVTIASTGNTTLASVVSVLNSYQDANGNFVFNATTTGNATAGGAAYLAAADAGTGVGTATAGAGIGNVLASGTGVTGLSADLTINVGGGAGSQLLSFKAGTTATAMAVAINNVSDATGITASAVGDNLQFLSSDYGSAANVFVKVVSEGTGGTFGPSLNGVNNASGTDIVATVNNVSATGSGNVVSFDSPTLAFSAALDPTSLTAGQNINFSVTGGGALFQLGPTVTAAQQARLGIQSVDTGSLGGTMGQLYELASGNSASLTNNASLAAQISSAAATQVSSLRGRLGAFQAATVDSNINALTNAVTNLTAAQSTIQDADFAAESANLTREQILVQSGTSVLGIANKNPENVLSLLR